MSLISPLNSNDRSIPLSTVPYPTVRPAGSVVSPHHLDSDPDPVPSFKIKAQDPWKSAQKCSYSIHFGLSSANWCGSGFRSKLSLMRIRMRKWILIFIWCGSGFLFDADADPGYQNDTDPCGYKSGCGSGSTTLAGTYVKYGSTRIGTNKNCCHFGSALIWLAWIQIRYTG